MSVVLKVNFLSSVLRTCAHCSLISQTKQGHAQIIIHGLLHNITLHTDLLLAYSRCGYLQYACNVFDKMLDRTMHTWNIMIAAHAQNSRCYDAFDFFRRFMKMGFRPDHYTLPPVFKSCASIRDPTFGAMLHGWVIKLGLQDYVVVGSSVLDFYLKCGSLKDATRVFGDMLWKDSVVWNSVISGFSRAGLNSKALNCFRDMLVEGVKVDAMAIPSILNACGKEGDMMKGKEIHGQIVKSVAFYIDIVILNALIDMYSKVGCLSSCENIFWSMSYPNLVSWTTMISCYGVHGRGVESLNLFEKMKDCGFRPNSITFTAVLSSCSHSGLIVQGRRIFNSICSVYGLEPSVEHYACMVDLLSRFGCLEEALGLINSMKVVPEASVWGALLSGSVLHQSVGTGEVAARHLFQLEPRNSSNYIALCSIYESLGIWSGVSRIRQKMRELDLAKTPGFSWITIGGKIHNFYQGDLSHPLTKLTCETLDAILKILIFTEDI